MSIFIELHVDAPLATALVRIPALRSNKTGLPLEENSYYLHFNQIPEIGALGGRGCLSQWSSRGFPESIDVCTSQIPSGLWVLFA